ncbi:MAG: hypothetical protein AB1925_30045 [Actinomycetota bacterium]
MTLAISYEAPSDIVEADARSELHLRAAGPHQKFVRIEEADGEIRLVPLDRLHESERAILESKQLYKDTRVGLREFAAGERASSDWLLDEE